VYNKLNKFEKIIFDVLACSLVLFYSYSAVLKPAATQYHRGIYVIITYILVFLTYKSRNKILRVVDYLLIAGSIFTVGYWISISRPSTTAPVRKRSLTSTWPFRRAHRH
jgi:TRAP-type uncharacterized transport system fused permease subunit